VRSRLFWASAALVGYTYAVFPIIVLLRARFRPIGFRSEPITPSVSMVIAAYNEVDSIEQKLDNCLALDYPSDRLEIIIASDGSTDGTDDVVRRRTSATVRLLSLPRSGKAAALNQAVATATGDILVFSDANSSYARDAISALVRPFADSSVGGVAGDQRYRSGSDTDAAGEGERAYWNLDRILKSAESRAGSAISATGAIYAIRRDLFRGVPVGVTDDFAVSTSVIEQGYRLVFAEDAVAWEPVSKSGRTEWGRKVRVITRGLRGVYERRALLNPFAHGFYAVQLISHKLLRRAMAIPLITLALVTPTLWRRGRLYQVTAVVQTCIYALGVTGLAVRDHPLGRSKVFAAPAFFLLANAAALVAIWKTVTGVRIDRWEPVRHHDEHVAPLPAEAPDTNPGAS
jgi:cellulose synthase/poly-beta-1,6-N-acetylglucosamine synthase-like glycosyltransferase